MVCEVPKRILFVYDSDVGDGGRSAHYEYRVMWGRETQSPIP